MITRSSGTRAVLSTVVTVCLLTATLPALAVVPAVTGVDSSSHPVDDIFYSDDSPEFSWDAASDLPGLLGSGATPDKAMAVTVAGDVAYVACNYAGLLTYDISEPASPTLLGSYDTTAACEGIAVAGDVVYLANSADGLQVIDVSEPGTPTLLATYDTPHIPTDIAVSGDVAYVADNAEGLLALDVSEPGTPTLLGSYDTPGHVSSVAVAGDLVYTTDSYYGMRVFDVSEPGTPTLVGTCDTPGRADGIAVHGDVAYVADDTSGVQAVDISDPSSPNLIGSLDTPGTAYGVTVVGDTLYVADLSGGLTVADVFDPTAPTILGVFDTTGSASDVVVAGDVAFVADQGGGLVAIDVSDFDAPTLLGSYDTTGAPYAVAVAGDIAYVADQPAGLQALDISDPSAPEFVGACFDTISAHGVTVAGDIAYVADFNRKLRVIDISQPGTPTLLASYSTGAEALSVEVAGDVAYVANYYDGLRVIDVSDPSAPSFLSVRDTPGIAISVTVAGDVAYVADYDSGLQMFDVSDPSAPAFLGAYDTPGAAAYVAVAGDVAYVADQDAGLQVIDVSDPSAPAFLGEYDTPGFSYGVAVVGDKAYVADHFEGLQVIDVSDPSAPSLLGTYDTPGLALGVTIEGDIAYVADDASGLQLIDVGHGPVGYSYAFDQSAATEPDNAIDSLSTTTGYTGIGDGDWYFHVRAVGEGRRGGATSHRRVRIDTAPPETVQTGAMDSYGQTTISLSASDAGSGVAATYYTLDGSQYEYADPFVLDVLGSHVFEYWSVDALGHVETKHRVDFWVRSNATDYTPISGVDRYETAIKTSQASFADGTADCVVIATGENWPDALGGAALAVAKNGPILLTRPGALPAGVITEIRRLGAGEAVILGGTGAVSTAVEEALDAELGATNVDRVWGVDRYKTAEEIAAETIAELGAGYDGTAFVGTGANFPDALAASPIAAAKGWPIFLSNPAGDPPTGVMKGLGVTDVLICGGTGVVSSAQENALEVAFGDANVERLWGGGRYDTGVILARYGVVSAGLAWDGLAMSTGENFPDALAGGVLAGRNGTVMFLTGSTYLPDSVRNQLELERDNIADVYFLGGTGAISQGVRDEVAAALH